MNLLRQLALDAGIIEQDVDEQARLLELYQKTNEVKSFDGSGYGIRFRAEDQKSTDQVFLADNRQQLYAMAYAVQQAANDSFDVPSNGVLPWMTSVYTNKIIEQMFQTRPIWKISTDFQQGAWGITKIFVPIVSYAGNAQLYSDFGTGGGNSVNVNYLERDSVILERMLSYGDLANAQMSMGKIDYVARLREGLATQIDLDINNIAFNGFAGREIYGLLNDPSLNATIPFPATAANPASSNWMYASYAEICANVRALYSQCIANAGGNLNFEDKAYLTVPPAVYTYLTDQNALGTQSVMQYLKGTFTGLEIVQSPNNVGASALTVQLIFDKVGGQDVLLNTFTSLYNSHGAIRKESAYVEKISYQVSGSIVAMAMGVATGTMSVA